MEPVAESAAEILGSERGAGLACGGDGDHGAWGAAGPLRLGRSKSLGVPTETEDLAGGAAGCHGAGGGFGSRDVGL